MSVRKRKWLTRNGEAKEAWIVDYSVNGSRHIETFERKKDADAYEAKVTVDVGKGIHIAPSRSVGVAEAGELWIKACEGDELERASIDAYRQHLRLHIKPYLSHCKLSQLSVPLVRKFKDDLRADKRSPAMVKRVIGSLGALLGDALERGLVATNVVRAMKRERKRGKDRQAERRQRGKLKVGVDIPTPDEIKRLIAHLREFGLKYSPQDKWRPLLLTAIFTGLRASELRGLRWDDVDLRHAKLHVRQRADRYQQIGKPKSESGERVIPLPPMIVNTLREWKLRCPKGDHGLVFPTSAGEIEYHSNIVHRGLGPAQIAAKIVTKDGRPKYPGLHSLRHFYASWCINREKDGGLELPLKMVQERLGHSTLAMTADTYGHLFPNGDDGTELAKAERFFLA
jgi:integrase